MSTPALVQQFYEDLWHRADAAALTRLLHEDFRFRGSLGAELTGPAAFWDYVRSVRGPLSDYRCEILACVAEGDTAFAKMRFSGRHTGVFRGYPPTGKTIAWLGAAHFTFRAGRIASLWVLGDLWSLEASLRQPEPR
jgi:steroid delta-isomerase-like uncharacterized protein